MKKQYVITKPGDINDKNELKLLSVNEARKILGIRHETVKSLIIESKIEAIKIHNKIKIPLWSLKKFQDDQINTFKNNLTTKESNEKDIVQNIINKNLV